MIKIISFITRIIGIVLLFFVKVLVTMVLIPIMGLPAILLSFIFWDNFYIDLVSEIQDHVWM